MCEEDEGDVETVEDKGDGQDREDQVFGGSWEEEEDQDNVGSEKDR